MLHRRTFLIGACAALVTANHSARAAGQKLRAAIIGHTGNGGYGHGMDALFANRPDIEVVAVADPDDAGRAAAQRRCAAKSAYADFREMIQREQPNLVSVAPRTTPFRREMLLAAVNAGAHVISEKPFVRAPADADQVLAIADRKGLKIAVAHQMRLAPAVVHLQKKINQGLIGDLQQLHAWGKQDNRAGGEDLLVLGVHLFDLMRLFAGDPQWCTARVMQGNRDARLADAHPAGEDIGPVLGDQVDAQFAFDHAVTATFTSRARLRDHAGHWGLELVGSKGTARILADIWPRVMVSTPARWTDTGRTDQWRPLDDDPTLNATPAERAVNPANARLVDDWLTAIKENREPACSGRNAAWAVEMVLATWRAGLTGTRVKLPLKDRTHPLLKQP